MSRAVLMSIKPQWCELIASGKKTVELRKTKPKLRTLWATAIKATWQAVIEPIKPFWPERRKS